MIRIRSLLQIENIYVHLEIHNMNTYLHQVHPRVAMLKNTNIESEMRGRVDYTDNRRVHYQVNIFKPV